MIMVPIGSVNCNPEVSASGFASRGWRRVNCICRSALAPRYEMAVVASIVALPPSGKNVALIRASRVRILTLSSPSRSLIRCIAESPDDVEQQHPGSPSVSAESAEKKGSMAVAAEDRKKQDFQRLREARQVRRKNLWRDFKEQHVVYKSDRDQWGLGVSPIFTVHEDEEGNRFQVDVNEDELLRRTGVDPNMTQFADEECKLLAEKKIELAKGHARDIQLGVVNPSPLSIVYQYKRGGTRSLSSFGSWPGSSLIIPAGAPRQFLSIVVPLLSLALLGIGVKWLLSRRRKDEDLIVKENNMSSMQTRKLKAQTRRMSARGTIDSLLPTPQENVDIGVVKSRVISGEEGLQNPMDVLGEIVEAGLSRENADEFQRKVVEIQAMARNARQEHESAEARSVQSLERTKLLEVEMKERRRVKRFENLSEDLDDVRRSGSESSEDPDLMPMTVKEFEEKRNLPAVENGQSSTSEVVNDGSGNYSSRHLVEDSIPETLSARFKPDSPKSTVMKPRIILSAEEARARIASKRARPTASSSSSSLKPEFRRSKAGFGQSNNNFGNVQPSSMETPTSTNPRELNRSVNATSLSSTESSKVDTSSHCGTPAAGVSIDYQPEGFYGTRKENINNSVCETNEPSSHPENVNLDHQERTKDTEAGESARGRGQLESKDEHEEMEWMRDDVLREIVFKVQANEEAGREPFYNLNSEQETLFFKGLERKFEREGDQVKKWIKDRVENIDYGSNGISVYDPPDSYELKWKEGVDRSSKSDLYDRFSQDRHRIINVKGVLTYTSPPVSEELTPSDPTEESRLPSSPAPSPLSSTGPPLPVSSSHTSPPLSKDLGNMHEGSEEKLDGEIKKRVVISSSPQPGDAARPYPSTSAGSQTDKAGKENWNHTKRWAKDLERKYAMETDPATRALMRELGQDLERWISKDEIEAASRMLNNGIEGEEEYVKMHYERSKERIKRQRETFGRDAMLSKYSEYKEESEEVELWWLSLPFVVCIGLRATVDSEQQTGLYSVDVAPALGGVEGLSSVPYHTVAFQDRGDAKKICTLINSQPEKLSVDGAEPVPFDPKELYKDAKSEGFKVTVIKKGQLQLSVDKPFDEVESRIIELGSARYFDELLSDRMIDMDSAVDDGLGFGRDPQ